VKLQPRRFAARALRMLNVPNVITLIRLGLVPAMAYYLADEAYEIALPIFLAAALSDLADGYIARRFKLVSTFGATLDPIADKLSMLVATVLLAWETLLPIWLAVAIVARDIIIVVGAIAFLMARGQLKIAPTRLSKVNTFMEFAVLLLVMAAAASWIETGAWMPTLFLIVFVTVVASGVQYVWLWGRKALVERRTR
jgi:cardiolipin synthase